MAELILALDLPTRGAAMRLLDRLPALRWVKLGSVLMTAEGPPLVRELVARGLHVFLDLKWHDIPNTVAGAVAAAAEMNVRMATVHASGGQEMLRSAAATAPDSLALVGVTVLTSHLQTATTDYTDGSTADYTDRKADSESVKSVVPAVGEMVERLAKVALDAGLAGVVCSPLEVERLRALLGPQPLIVVPGIRRPGDDPGDQKRIGGPAEVAKAGATHLVVGRPILQAPDPAGALRAFLDELNTA